MRSGTARLYGARGHRVRRYTVFLSAFTLAASYWAFTILPYTVADITAMFVMGIAVGPLSALVGVILQTRTPEELLGRVTSATGAFFTAAMPLAILLAGVAVDLFGLTPVLVTSAALITCIPLWIALSPSARSAALEFD